MKKEDLERYLAEGLSLDQIAARVDRHPSTVSSHLKKYGLDPVGVKYRSKGGISREVLTRMVNAKLSLVDMAYELGVSKTTIRRWLKRYGFSNPATERRAETRRARELGLKEVELECARHGRTMFILEGRGYHRCLKCRQAAVAEWRRRAKRRLVERAGGACVLCGYNRWLGALEFHHLDPSQKSFGLSMRGLTQSIEKQKAEADKCVLLCANCHAEVEGGFSSLGDQPRLAA